MLTQQLINGVTVGGIYALIALGYTMVYGILKIVNFAHGDVFMVGSFLGLLLVQSAGLPIYIAYPLAMIVTAGVGILIERVCYRPIRVNGADALSILIAALGVSIFLENFAQLVWGTETHSYVQEIKETTYEFEGYTQALVGISGKSTKTYYYYNTMQNDCLAISVNNVTNRISDLTYFSDYSKIKNLLNTPD